MLTTGEIKRKAVAGEIEFTRNVLHFSDLMGLAHDARLELIASMDPVHFQKTMESEKHPGVVQYVYRISFRGQQWYAKFTEEGPQGLRMVSLKWRKKLSE